MTRLRISLMAALALVAGCISDAPKEHPLAALLVGREVIWDMPQALVEKDTKFPAVPERQIWAADGTYVFHWRPLLAHWKTARGGGRWRVEGRNVYCQTGRKELSGEEHWNCYRVKVDEGGTRVHFILMDRDWFIDFRKDWHGTFKPQ